MENIANYIGIAQSLVELMQPLIEVVIHDVATNKIIFIAGGLSNRVIGDASLLTPEEISTSSQQITGIVYSKLSEKGGLIKSISIPIMLQNQVRYLMCINCAVSVFQDMQQLAQLMLNTTQLRAQPSVLFKNDWQEQLHSAIYQFIQKHNTSLDQLTNKQKKQLIKELYEKGGFNEKHAADYIARVLTISRATVFNYLREWKS